MNEIVSNASSAPACDVGSRNFVDLVRGFAATRPNEEWLTVAQWGRDGRLEHRVSYAAFDERVRRLAARLQRDLARGDRALVMFDNDDHYAVGMLACFYAGVIAVPVFPPASNRPQHLERLIGIAADSQARCVLTTRAWQPLVEAAAGFGRPLVIASDDAGESLSVADWRAHSPADADIAFLQYTSGSTSAPKGVMVSHANLMANERAMQRGMSIGPADKYVCWNPLYHDMGLIAGLFMPLFAGIPVVLMSPWAFAESPQRWLELISAHHATVSGGSDFAYRLCVDRIGDAQAARLDLSSWRVAYTGAEPVRADTEAAFIERFAPSGFRAQAAYPCYGLAEATLYVAGDRPGSGVTTGCFSPEALALGQAVACGVGVTLVACGAVAEGHALEIADPASGAPQEAGQVGEICVAGPSLAQGYWNQPQATQASFVQRGGRRWLRTGDLGFVHGGQLFIAGRVKDIIIVRGHNLYPQDIEQQVEREVDAARAGRVAAFAVTTPQGVEGVGIAMEVSRTMQKRVPASELAAAVTATVADAFGEPVSVLVLLQPGALPKTSSGKLQRRACRQGWLDRSLQAYAICEFGTWIGCDGSAANRPEPIAPAPHAVDELTVQIAAIWSAVLQTELRPDALANAHFFRLGGHSLLAAQVVAQTAERFGAALLPQALFEHPKLVDFAREVGRRIGSGAVGQPAAIPRQPRGRGPQPLSTQQRRLWLVDRLAASPRARAAYNITFALQLAGDVDAARLGHALRAVALRHDVLRMRFVENEEGELQAVVDDACTASLLRREGPLDAALDEIGRVPFDLCVDQPWRAALVCDADGAVTLVMCFHHIAVDGWSIAVFAREFSAFYNAAGRDPAAVLPPPEVQYGDYAAWQQADVGSASTTFWRDRLAGLPAESTLPADRGRPPAPSHAGDVVAVRLEPPLVEGLRQLAADADASLFQLLMAVFMLLVHRESGQDDIAVGTDVAGRDHPQLVDAIGFFVNVLPVRSRLATPDGSLLDWFSGFRRGLLDAIAHRELPFERIVDAARVPRRRNRHPLVQMLFVLHNTPPVAFDLQGLGTRLVVPPAREAKFDLAVFGREQDGALDVEWVYANDLYERDTVERFARGWVDLLRRVVAAPQAALRELLAAPREAALADFERTAGVRSSFPSAQRAFPVVLEPQGNDIDAIAWAGAHAEQLEAMVQRHGGIVFRGFGLRTPQDFEAFAEAIEPELFGDYGDLPRKEGGRKTYRSTPYPEQEMILFHNESAHTGRWPRKQWFFCELPALRGGATPIVDGREMLRRLPHEIVDAFETKGLLYLRTFHPGLDVRWQDFYKTDSRAEVQARLDRDGIEARWLEGDLLQTRTRAPGVIVHPLTGERVFFNQVQLHHAACLAPDLREALVELVGADRLPRQVTYGDGSPIDDDSLRIVGEAYEACAVRLDWRQGDVIMLDNMLAAHARDPFEGPRKVVVAMGAMWDLNALRDAPFRKTA